MHILMPYLTEAPVEYTPSYLHKRLLQCNLFLILPFRCHVPLLLAEEREPMEDCQRTLVPLQGGVGLIPDGESEGGAAIGWV